MEAWRKCCTGNSLLLFLSSVLCVFCSGSESGIWRLYSYFSGVDHPHRPGCWDKVIPDILIMLIISLPCDICTHCVCVCAQADWAGSWWSSDWCVWDLLAGVHTSQDALHMPLPQSLPHCHQQSLPHCSWWDKPHHVNNSMPETCEL